MPVASITITTRTCLSLWLLLIQIHKPSLIVAELPGTFYYYFLLLVNNGNTAVKLTFGYIDPYRIL